MLTGPEQRKLHRIERALAAEDPRLARSLQEVDLSARRRGRWPYTLAVAGSFALLLICVLAALPVLAVLSAGTAALAIMVWIRRAPRHRAGTRPDRPQ